MKQVQKQLLISFHFSSTCQVAKFHFALNKKTLESQTNLLWFGDFLSGHGLLVIADHGEQCLKFILKVNGCNSQWRLIRANHGQPWLIMATMFKRYIAICWCNSYWSSMMSILYILIYVYICWRIVYWIIHWCQWWHCIYMWHLILMYQQYL